MRRILGSLLQNQHGVSAAEYALILSILGAALALAAILLGDTIAGSMSSSSAKIANCGGGC